MCVMNTNCCPRSGSSSIRGLIGDTIRLFGFSVGGGRSPARIFDTVNCPLNHFVRNSLCLCTLDFSNIRITRNSVPKLVNAGNLGCHSTGNGLIGRRVVGQLGRGTSNNV